MVSEELLTQVASDVPAIILAVWYVKHLHQQAVSLLVEIRDELRVARALRMNGDRNPERLTGTP